MGGLTKKELRTEKDLTPKQKMFVEIMVQDHGQITQAEALKRAGYDCKDINSARSTASQLMNRRINPHVAKLDFLSSSNVSQLLFETISYHSTATIGYLSI